MRIYMVDKVDGAIDDNEVMLKSGNLMRGTG